MISRLLPLLFAAAVFAEAPRPRAGFEGVGVRFTSASASGSGKAEDSATGFEVTGNFPLLKSGSWQYDWGFRYAQTRHDWNAAPVSFDLVRGASLNLSGYASTEAGRSRYAVLQVNSDAASGVSFGDALTVQALYGADWRRSETFTLGYLFLAETRAVRSPMVLVVPTFRWQFAPDWSLGTGRKSLVLERKLDEAWRASRISRDSVRIMRANASPPFSVSVAPPMVASTNSLLAGPSAPKRVVKSVASSRPTTSPLAS